MSRVITITFPPPFRFEVRKGKRVYMTTEHRSCMPDKKTLASLKKAGYSAYVNGQPYKAKKV